jgi:hypothetical protein
MTPRNDFPGATAGVTRSVHTEEPLLEGQLPGPLAATTACRLRTFCRPRPRTGLAARHLGNLDARFATVQDIEKIDFKVVPKIGAALSSTAPTAGSGPARAAKNIAEQVVEEVAEIAEIAKIPAGMPRTGPAHPGMTEAVIAGAFLRIREDGVSLGNLLETLLGLRIVRIAVRMALQSKFPIGFFEIGLACAPLDAQNLVKIPLAQTGPLFRSLRVAIGEHSSRRNQCQVGRSIFA